MSRRVLLVDNEASFRRLARVVLTSWGHVVVAETGTAAEAMHHATELRPDAVIADIGLPDGNGFSLAADLVTLPSPPRVVLISADDDVVHPRAAARAGAVGFVPKAEIAGTRLRDLIEGDETAGA